MSNTAETIIALRRWAGELRNTAKGCHAHAVSLDESATKSRAEADGYDSDAKHLDAAADALAVGQNGPFPLRLKRR